MDCHNRWVFGLFPKNLGGSQGEFCCMVYFDQIPGNFSVLVRSVAFKPGNWLTPQMLPRSRLRKFSNCIRHPDLMVTFSARTCEVAVPQTSGFPSSLDIQQVMSALADRLENEGGGSQLERPTALRQSLSLKTVWYL